MFTIEYLRSFRLGSYAWFDLNLAFVGMLLLSPLLTKLFEKFSIHIPKKNWIFLTLPISVIIHLATGNMTQMTKDVLDLQGNLFIKILMLGSLYLGFQNIYRLKSSKKR